MGNVLAAIGEALIDFIPDRSGCEFDEVTAFAPKVGGAPANVCAAFSKLGGRSRLLTRRLKTAIRSSRKVLAS